MLFLMISTAIVDAFWIFYWGDAWNKNKDNTWINVLHHIVFILSIIELIVKIATIIIAFISEKENIVENLPESLGNLAQKL